MKLSSLARRFTGRQHPTAAELESARLDDQMEREGAALCDANLARIRRVDPDADRIFEITFTDAYRDPSLSRRMVEQLQAYARAKCNQDRMDLYSGIFAGLGE